MQGSFAGRRAGWGARRRAGRLSIARQLWGAAEVPHRETLENGLELCVLADARLPIVSTVLAYRVGARDERAAEAGAAHFLEHMMFKGSENFAAGEIDRVTEARGGSNNAFTSHDVTAYYFSFAKEHWTTALEIERDRMSGLRLDPQEVDAERQVILEELAMYESDPWDVLQQESSRRLYPDHPYGAPVLGTRDSLRALGSDELFTFHRQHYLADNAVLVVAGDVSLEEVREEAARLPSGGERPSRPAVRDAGALPGVRRYERTFGEVSRLLLSLPAPGASQVKDHAMTRLLAVCLAGGRSSRLNHSLVEEEKLALWVDADVAEMVGPASLSIALEVAPGVDEERVEQRVFDELERLAAEGVTDDELRRAQKMTFADWTFGHERLQRRALTAALALALHDERYPEASVQAALNASASRGHLDGEARVRSRSVRHRLVDSRVGPVTERLRVRRIPGSGTFALRVWFPCGALDEATPGVACLTGRALAEGTARRDWLRVAVELEDQGMSLSTFGSMELFGLSLDGLASDWQQGLDWASELLYEPAFAADRVEWLRQQTLAELDSLSDQPDVLTGWHFLAQLYPGHAAGRPVQGDRDSLGEVGAEHCREFHRMALERRPIVTLAGDLPEAEVAEALASRFGSRGADRLPRVSPELTEPSTASLTTSARDQAHLFLGHLTVTRDHEDLAALEVLAVVLGAGSGLNGRIPQRIREDEGLAYSAQANTVSGASRVRGRLAIYLATAEENLEKAEASVRDELARLLEDGVSDEEFESARAFLLGREPFRQETARQWGDLLAQAGYFETPWDDPSWRRERLARVTRRDIEQSARNHVHPDRLHVTRGVPRTS